MDNSSFSKEFSFNEYTRKTNYITDNRIGANFHYFGYMLEGTSHFESDGISFDVDTNELVYIPKLLPYRSFWYGSPQVRFISLGFGVFPEEEPKFYHLQRVELNDEERKLIKSISLGASTTCKDVGLLFCLIDKLLPKMTSSSKKPSNTLMKKACDIINSDTGLTVCEVAKRCGVSESGLYAVFRKEGTTPIDFRQKLLCEKATILLSTTDMTVEAISDALGFSTPSYFRRVLKKQLGKTPKEIRKSLI